MKSLSAQAGGRCADKRRGKAPVRDIPASYVRAEGLLTEAGGANNGGYANLSISFSRPNRKTSFCMRGIMINFGGLLHQIQVQPHHKE